MKINIIDSLCGTGKTSWAIQEMRKHPEKRYIYITPLLTEVERIQNSCPENKFYQPTQTGKGKLENFNKLLERSVNIVSTHALFKTCNQQTLDLLEANGYTLVLDEVFDVIEQINLKKNDLPSILNYSHIDENHFLIWDDMEYDGRYNDIKDMALANNLMVFNDTLLVWNFPINIFRSFNAIYILTYLFSSQIQRYYYDLHGMEYCYWKVYKDSSGEYRLKEHDFAPEKHDNIKINIYEGELNNIGNKRTALSMNWYKKRRDLRQVLKNNTYNYFFNIQKSKSDDSMWTTFKDFRNSIKGKGFTKGFIPLNSRATNDYQDKTVVAYTANRFFNPFIKQFFEQKGIEVEEDGYALSELLQWLFRSAIRKGETVNLYIPSSRMRELLVRWLNGEEVTKTKVVKLKNENPETLDITGFERAS